MLGVKRIKRRLSPSATCKADSITRMKSSAALSRNVSIQLTAFPFYFNYDFVFASFLHESLDCSAKRLVFSSFFSEDCLCLFVKVNGMSSHLFLLSLDYLSNA